MADSGAHAGAGTMKVVTEIVVPVFVIACVLACVKHEMDWAILFLLWATFFKIRS